MIETVNVIENQEVDAAFYDVKDVQARLRISRTNAYKLIRREDFPKIKIGSAIRIPADQFHRWVANQLGESVG